MLAAHRCARALIDGVLAAFWAKSGSSKSRGSASDLKSAPELVGKSNVATATSAESVQPLSPSKTAARQMNKRTRDVVDLHDSDSDYNDEIE